LQVIVMPPIARIVAATPVGALHTVSGAKVHSVDDAQGWMTPTSVAVQGPA